MSTINAFVYAIDKFEKHDNADTLYCAQIAGWQCITNKIYEVGDKVIFIEPGSVLTKEFSDSIEVTPYLKTKTNKDGEKVLVVSQTRLRGEPSYGIILPGNEYSIGDDLAEQFGIIKFEPPVKLFNGGNVNSVPENPKISRYTDIDNLRKYPNIFDEGEMVICVSKIHGTNSRVGYIMDEEGNIEWLAGSKRLMRKKPEGFDPLNIISDTYLDELYWYPLTLQPVIDLFQCLIGLGFKTATLYGEIFGGNIQIFNYGRNKIDYCAFDLCVNGSFADYDGLTRYLQEYNVQQPPVMYRGPYNIDKIREAAEAPNTFGGNHIQEGVVVRPIAERFHPKVGRLVMKYCSDAYYLNSKVENADTTDV